MITITIDGNASVINKLLPKYAAANGWAEGMVDESGVPVTALEVAQKGLENHLRDVVSKQVIREARFVATSQASKSVDSEMKEVEVVVTES